MHSNIFFLKSEIPNVCDRQRNAWCKTQSNTWARKQMTTNCFQGWSANSHMSARSTGGRWSSDLLFLTTLLMSNGFAPILTEPYTTSQTREKTQTIHTQTQKTTDKPVPRQLRSFAWPCPSVEMACLFALTWWSTSLRGVKILTGGRANGSRSHGREQMRMLSFLHLKWKLLKSP